MSLTSAKGAIKNVSTWPKHASSVIDILLKFSGLLLLTMGVWLRTDDRFRDFLSERYRMAIGEAPTLYAFSYVLILLGPSLLVAAIFLYCGTNQDTKPLLCLYALGTYLLLMFTIGIFYAMDGIDLELSDALNYMVQHYYQAPGIVQETLNRLQQAFRICLALRIGFSLALAVFAKRTIAINERIVPWFAELTMKKLDPADPLPKFGMDNDRANSTATGKKSSIQIFMRMTNGTYHTLKLPTNASIQYIKGEIQDKEGIPSDQQRLLYAGQHLRDTCSLTDYNIHSESTLQLLLTLRGGGKATSSRGKGVARKEPRGRMASTSSRGKGGKVAVRKEPRGGAQPRAPQKVERWLTAEEKKRVKRFGKIQPDCDCRNWHHPDADPTLYNNEKCYIDSIQFYEEVICGMCRFPTMFYLVKFVKWSEDQPVYQTPHGPNILIIPNSDLKDSIETVDGYWIDLKLGKGRGRRDAMEAISRFRAGGSRHWLSRREFKAAMGRHPEQEELNEAMLAEVEEEEEEEEEEVEEPIADPPENPQFPPPPEAQDQELPNENELRPLEIDEREEEPRDLITGGVTMFTAKKDGPGCGYDNNDDVPVAKEFGVEHLRMAYSIARKWINGRKVDEDSRSDAASTACSSDGAKESKDRRKRRTLATMKFRCNPFCSICKKICIH